MSVDVDAIALLRAVLGDNCASDEVARKHLDRARQRNIDPLDYCSHFFGLGNQVVWRRAAGWAGYEFAETTPTRQPLATIADLSRLGEMRSLRQPVLGKELVFYAPRFANVLTLRQQRVQRAGFGRLIRFVPPDAIEAGLARAASAQLMDHARQRITQLWPHASAAVSLPLRARLVAVLLLILLIVVTMAASSIAQPVLVPLVSVILVVPALLRLAAALPRAGPPAPRALPDAELPFYTVLIPLRDEAQMVPMLKRAMSAIDYPAHKLDIKFVVESASPETVQAVQRVLDDPRFRLVAVPQGRPHTKPKAIDYALPLARGAYVVVYDAEDVPDPDQLRRAASRFAADPTLACLQAELVPENAPENVLTALFAGEYAGLFGRLLPALARWGLPVPLGGTSNHFRTDVLRELGGWDAFNVTEDADLGVRLRRRGLRAEMLDSRTLEEAPVTLDAWMAQRTRWMKGWMQTFIVHNRAPVRLWRELGWRAFLGFELLVGGMVVTSLVHTMFIGTLAARLVTGGLGGFVPLDGWDLLGVAALTLGYGGAMAIVVSGLIRQRAWHLLAVQALLPAYWVLHSIATLYAARELVLAPNHWAKTTHGVTRVSRGGVPSATAPAQRSGAVATKTQI